LDSHVSMVGFWFPGQSDKLERFRGFLPRIFPLLSFRMESVWTTVTRLIMKKLIMTSFALVAIAIACSTTQQRQALNTIGGVETTATVAVDSYYTLVIKGQLPTNDVPKVSKAYDSLQASVRLALTIVQNNTNALAPSNLVLEQMDLLNLVNNIKGGK